MMLRKECKYLTTVTRIQFTVETENEKPVPFLDTRVCRDENNTIKLNW